MQDVIPSHDNSSPLDRSLGTLLEEIDRNASFLEVGVGEGRLTRQAARRFRRVVAIDWDPRSLITARPKVGGRAVSLLMMDAHRLGFPDELFDVVAEFNALGHFSDLGRVVAEMIRVMRPNGVLLFLASWKSEVLMLEAGWLQARLTAADLDYRQALRGRVRALVAGRPGEVGRAP
ncbi:MAG: class I SAM-dependent methyltransferase [Bacillota bacterium]